MPRALHRTGVRSEPRVATPRLCRRGPSRRDRLQARRASQTAFRLLPTVASQVLTPAFVRHREGAMDTNWARRTYRLRPRRACRAYGNSREDSAGSAITSMQRAARPAGTTTVVHSPLISLINPFTANKGPHTLYSERENTPYAARCTDIFRMKRRIMFAGREKKEQAGPKQTRAASYGRRILVNHSRDTHTRAQIKGRRGAPPSDNTD